MASRGLIQVQAPTAEPVSLADMKAWMRVDIPDDDPLISVLIGSARRYVESRLNRQLISATWQLTLDRFPRYSSIAVWQFNSDAIWQQRLPVTQLSGQWYPDRAAIRVTRPPLQAVQALTYTDGTGIVQTLQTLLPAGVAASGVQIVTPYTMAGIYAGQQYVVDLGAAQETITVSSVAAATFTATFAGSHPPGSLLMPTLQNVGVQTLPVFGVDITTEPGRIAPNFGNIWPIVRQQLGTVSLTYVAGYGPGGTTVAANISAGTQTVTPASMAGIYPLTRLFIDAGTLQEEVVVSATTATTFTATFNAAHTGPVAVAGSVPKEITAAVKMLAAHWYEHREAVDVERGASASDLPLGCDALLNAAAIGEYE